MAQRMPLPWLCRCLLWENALRIAIFTVCQLEQYVKSAKYQHNKYRKLLALLAKDQIVYASFLKATHLLAALPTVRLTRTRDEPDPPFSHMFEPDEQVGLMTPCSRLWTLWCHCGLCRLQASTVLCEHFRYCHAGGILTSAQQRGS